MGGVVYAFLTSLPKSTGHASPPCRSWNSQRKIIEIVCFGFITSRNLGPIDFLSLFSNRVVADEQPSFHVSPRRSPNPFFILEVGDEIVSVLLFRSKHLGP